MARSLAVFVLALIALHGVVALGEPWTWDLPIAVTANLAAVALRALGAEAEVQGNVLVSSVMTVEVIGDCTPVNPLVIFLSAVIAFPGSNREKLVGFLIGIPAIVAINVVRLVSLCYVGRSYPEAFDFVHVVIWQSLMVFLTLLLWIVWATWVRAEP